VTVHREQNCEVREKTNEMQQLDVFLTISQHVSGIIMPIFRRPRRCVTAYGVLRCALTE